jgi:hypothetical protein
MMPPMKRATKAQTLQIKAAPSVTCGAVLWVEKPAKPAPTPRVVSRRWMPMAATVPAKTAFQHSDGK